MPKYVEVSYECMVWTSYTEHLNEVIEQLQYAGTFWGDKDKFKFRTEVSDFDVVNEVGENSERINRLQFTVAVKAYLLPEKFDGQSTTKKAMSTKRVVVATETDVTSGSGRLEGFLTTPSPYYDSKDLIDFLSLNGSKIQNPTTNNTITFTGIKLIKTPASLSSVVTSGITIAGEAYDIKVYINGTRYYPTTHFAVSLTLDEFTIIFKGTGYINPITNLPEDNLGFVVDSGDEISITGKFIDV